MKQTRTKKTLTETEVPFSEAFEAMVRQTCRLLGVRTPKDSCIMLQISPIPHFSKETTMPRGRLNEVTLRTHTHHGENNFLLSPFPGN